MERLLSLKLTARGCAAEAWLNGVALARVGGSGGVGAGRETVTLAVHEFTLSGANRIELVIGGGAAATPAPPQQHSVAAACGAELHLLLPRIGNAVDEGSARTLALLDWKAAAGDSVTLPLTRSSEVTLPVSFPRWRWLDAPLIEADPALHGKALAFVQTLAFDLARGDPASFLLATRLRTEELALAYQREPQAEVARLRDHLLALHAAGRLTWLPLAAAGFQLRRLANGQLLECLDAEGQPALRTAADDNNVALAFPLRLAVVEGNIYVLR